MTGVGVEREAGPSPLDHLPQTARRGRRGPWHLQVQRPQGMAADSERGAGPPASLAEPASARGCRCGAHLTCL